MAPRAGADCVVIFPSALGWMAVVGQDRWLKRLSFGHASAEAALAALSPWPVETARPGRWNQGLVERLQAYAAGAREDFLDVALDLGPQGEFQRRVVDRCRRIAYGMTLTYRALASASGSPRAARAVGNVMASNPVPLVVPCHRVVASAGLGGYSAGEGTRLKLRLLEMEAGQGSCERRQLSGTASRPHWAGTQPRLRRET